MKICLNSPASPLQRGEDCLPWRSATLAGGEGIQPASRTKINPHLALSLVKGETKR